MTRVSSKITFRFTLAIEPDRLGTLFKWHAPFDIRRRTGKNVGQTGVYLTANLYSPFRAINLTTFDPVRAVSLSGERAESPCRASLARWSIVPLDPLCLLSDTDLPWLSTRITISIAVPHLYRKNQRETRRKQKDSIKISFGIGYVTYSNFWPRIGQSSFWSDRFDADCRLIFHVLQPFWYSWFRESIEKPEGEWDRKREGMGVFAAAVGGRNAYVRCQSSNSGYWIHAISVLTYRGWWYEPSGFISGQARGSDFFVLTNSLLRFIGFHRDIHRREIKRALPANRKPKRKSSKDTGAQGFAFTNAFDSMILFFFFLPRPICVNFSLIISSYASFIFDPLLDHAGETWRRRAGNTALMSANRIIRFIRCGNITFKYITMYHDVAVTIRSALLTSRAE